LLEPGGERCEARLAGRGQHLTQNPGVVGVRERKAATLSLVRGEATCLWKKNKIMSGGRRSSHAINVGKSVQYAVVGGGSTSSSLRKRKKGEKKKSGAK